MKIRLIFLLLLPLLCWPGTGLANDFTIGRAELSAIFRAIATREAPWPKEELEIHNFSAIPNQVDLPLGKLGYQLLSHNQGRLLGQRTVTVLLTIDGKPQKKVKMHGDVHHYGQVLVARHRLARHTVLSRADLAVARKDITMFAHDLVQDMDEAVGQQLSTSLRAGAIIFARNLRPMPLVKRGDLVTIQAANANLRVTVKGEARGSGARGEAVRVKNLMSRRIITARVVDNGLVAVDF